MVLSGHESSGSRALGVQQGGLLRWRNKRGEESAGRLGGCHKMKDDVWIIVKI